MHFKKMIVFLLLSGTTISANAQLAATFEDIQLPEESFWNGSDLSGKFTSGRFTFYNSYNKAWSSWNGFAYSNKTDKTTPGWSNQFSAITGKGVFNSANYAVAYDFGNLRVKISKPDSLSGVYVTNSTYAYLTLRDGDLFTEKFGGKSGQDPDFFRLIITGLGINGDTTGVVTFYLADFRSQDSKRDLIIREWTWVDLSSLGVISELRFSLESSDVGEYGMNTPAYFCLDNLDHQDMSPVVNRPVSNIFWFPGSDPHITVPLDSVFLDPDDPGFQGKFSIQSLEGDQIANIRLTMVASTGIQIRNAVEISILPGTFGREKVTLSYISKGKSAECSFLIQVNAISLFVNRSENDLKVFPNPFQDIFYIELLTDVNCIRINDMNGNLLYYDHFQDKNKMLIDALKNFSSGVYVLSVSGKEINKVCKLLKK